MKLCPLCQKVYDMQILTECVSCKTRLVAMGDQNAVKNFEQELQRDLYELETKMGLHAKDSNSFFLKNYYVWGGVTSILIVIVGLLSIYL